MNATMRNVLSCALLIAGACLVGTDPVWAGDQLLKPFILGSQGPGDLAGKVESVKTALKAKGFQIVGEYEPSDGTHIFVITDDSLKRTAAKSEKGGFGAVQRVAVTQAGGEIQVAYTNPVYMAHAYRLKGDLADVARKLEAALGKVKEFGSEKGMTAEKLHKYHYMFGMPYFDEPDELARHGSFDQAVKAVETNLAAGKGGVTKLYRVDIPGKQEVLFGVKMTEGCSGDKFIMDKIDFAPVKHTAHLPYEMLVLGDKVYALNARFRIAIDFPDLSMMGEHSFMKIMCAPDAIKKALTAAAGGRAE
jgi:hypothetical protein